MVTIELRFLAGRFHATPWGRHVNEGAPEWPPSPFRLLRALYDVWMRKCADIPTERFERLLRALALTPPRFLLPPAGASHLRLFLRQGGESESDKKLVFDAFVVVDPADQIRVGWPELELDDAEQRDLAELVSCLTYLGRAESLVEARLSMDKGPIAWNCTTALDREGTDPVRVACLAAPDRHLAYQPPKSKAPLTWLEACGWGTAETFKEKLSDPPALKWQSYGLDRNALSPPKGRRAPARGPRTHAMLFALDASVLPLATDAILIAERFRICAMSLQKRLNGGDESAVTPRISGRANGEKLLEHHAHAYYLPLDLDGDGALDHVLVRAREPFTPGEERALAGVRSLWPHRGKPALTVRLVATGAGAERLEEGRKWRSVTPFVTARHFKGETTPELWIRGELERALHHHFGDSAPKIVSLKPIEEHRPLRTRARRWFEFLRNRKDDPQRPGHGFELELDRDMEGPWAVGYAAHFGLGLFAAVKP